MPKTKTPKRWTMLAWIAGDNNLDSYGLNDIKEMKRIGSTKDVDVVVWLATGEYELPARIERLRLQPTPRSLLP